MGAYSRKPGKRGGQEQARRASGPKGGNAADFLLAFREATAPLEQTA